MAIEKMVKSFAEMVEDTYGINDFDGDQYVYELAKSLTLGSSPMFTNPGMGSSGPAYGTQYADATAIKLQNMDSTLTSVLFQENHFVLFNWLQKVPSLGPLYEYNKRKTYGSGRAQRGFGEGLAPKSGVGAYERDNSVVRFMGVQRGLTHQLGLTGQLGGTVIDPVAEENRNGTLELLEAIERQLVFGQSMITNESGSTVNYDGLLRQLGQARPQNVIDLQGAPMYLEQFEDGAYRLFQEGYVKSFQNVQAFMTGSVIADLSKLRYPNERQDITARIPAQGWDTGVPLAGHVTNFGRIPFEPSVFLEEVAGSTPLGISETGAPTPPVGTGSTATYPGYFSVAAATDPNTTPASKLPAGTYYYWVSAFNESGESQVIPFGASTIGGTPTAVTTTAGQVAQITIGYSAAFTAGQSIGFRIYRSTAVNPFLGTPGNSNTVTDSTCGLIATVPIPNSTNTAIPASATTYYTNGSSSGTSSTNYEMSINSSTNVLVYNDRNQTVPRSGMVLMLERSEENMVIAQMSPLIKWPLAITNTTINWILMLYHTFVVKAPERQIVFRNVGRLT